MEHWKWQPDILVQKVRAAIPRSLYNSGSWYWFYLASSACSPWSYLHAGTPFFTLNHPRSLWYLIQTQYMTVTVFCCELMHFMSLTKALKNSESDLCSTFCLPEIGYTSFSFPLAQHTEITVVRQRNQWLTLQVPHSSAKVSSNWNHFFSHICELCSPQIARSWATQCTSKLCILF